MKKSLNNTISRFIAVLYLLFSLLYFAFNDPNFYIYITILITTPLIDLLVFTILPTKKSEKNSDLPRKVSKIQDNFLSQDELILTKPLEKLSTEEFERLCILYIKAKELDIEDQSKNAIFQTLSLDKTKISKWQREEALKRQLKYDGQ